TTLAAIFFWFLIFTVAETKPKAGQKFHFMFYEEIISGDDSEHFGDVVQARDVFSYEVLSYLTVPLTGGYGGFTLSGKFMMGEGNLMLVSDMPIYDSTKNLLTESYFQTVAKSYWYLDAEINEWLSDCEAYLVDCFGGSLEGEADRERINEIFLARMAKQKDKRFKTAAEKQEGLALEIGRIEKLRRDYLAVKGYLDEGVLSLASVDIDDEENDIHVHGDYGIRIDAKRLQNMKKFAYVAGYDENGENFTTVESLTFVVFPWSEQQPDLQWEALGCISYLVGRYLDT
ncbi:MAG: hypothetical protein ACI4U2_02545, partial [Christensenellaceae bacterium]